MYLIWMLKFFVKNKTFTTLVVVIMLLIGALIYYHLRLGASEKKINDQNSQLLVAIGIQNMQTKQIQALEWDTATLRDDVRSFSASLKLLKAQDEGAGKGLSEKYPDINTIKRKPK